MNTTTRLFQFIKFVLKWPLAVVIVTTLFFWMLSLLVFLVPLKLITDKDYSRGWMVNWAIVLLKKIDCNLE